MCKQSEKFNSIIENYVLKKTEKIYNIMIYLPYYILEKGI